ncbi:hypothetical protein N7495_006932 [Penicillium taxi]|uniref:uncharacterized protein n=1 Tax=Penicillium taxi TaxID=168475 RepID=UPI00254517AD|nr:uncharacterized protein N7495_006932 [Penicillium taxi]KAJ5895241.1 hypothetical protein N7495_006932 [Penicillium taxi]
MTATSALLKQTITPALLEGVRNFWFDHINGEDALILPSQKEMKRWFMRDTNFDQACVAQFQPALEVIITSQASATDMIDVIDQSSPIEWLSLLLLLDQVPRNCFRGDEAKKVFERFDPLAVKVAIRAIGAGVPIQSSEVRYRLSYRLWFHLPLMHSENLAVHEKAIETHEGIARDLGELLQKEVETMSDDEKACYDVLSVQHDATKAWLSSTFDFEKRHKAIIEQFGRYPHRNEVLGRVSTEEEIEYLNNGGETFS